MTFAQGLVIGQHVRQAPGMGQAVAQGDGLAPLAGEAGEELDNAIVQAELAGIHQGHHGGGRHGFGERSQKKHRLGALGGPEIAREPATGLGHQDGGALHPPVGDPVRHHLGGQFQLGPVP